MNLQALLEQANIFFLYLKNRKTKVNISSFIFLLSHVIHSLKKKQKVQYWCAQMVHPNAGISVRTNEI